jgi:Helix-turn-helix domain
MDERLRFVARLLEGEKMAVLCREFDISRKTGYKIFERYQHCGVEGLTDRSRRPYRQANKLPACVERLIVQSSTIIRAGVHQRSGRSSGAVRATFSFRRSAQCTRYSTGTTWSVVDAGSDGARNLLLQQQSMSRVLGILTARRVYRS